jgi:hypothetical protein
MMTNTKKLSSVLVAFMTMLILEPFKAHAQQSNPPDKAFSFAVYGDSRSMMYRIILRRRVCVRVYTILLAC